MNSPRRLVTLGAAVMLVAAVIALTSCAYPSVSVRTARLDSVRLSGLTVDVFFDVENPNKFALPLEQVDWSLRLFDVRVGAGASRMDQNIAAQRTTRVKMPLSISFEGVSGVVNEVRRSRSIPWDIDGTAKFSAPTGPIALDFDDGGRWDNPLH